MEDLSSPVGAFLRENCKFGPDFSLSCQRRARIGPIFSKMTRPERS
jgi:hypothetical protein